MRGTCGARSHWWFLCSLLVVASGGFAAAEVVIPDPASGVYYGWAATAGEEVRVGKRSRIVGDIHGNELVSVKKDALVDGDVSGGEVELQGEVTGTVTQAAPPLALPVPFDEAAARALADRVFEGNHDFTDATINDVVFVSGHARIYGTIAGNGTIISAKNIDVMAVGQGEGAAHLGAGSRLALIAFRQLRVRDHRALRGVLYGGIGVTLERDASFEGTIVAGVKVDLKDDAEVTFLDPDELPPSVFDLAPADGGFTTPQPQISAAFADDLSGVDPASFVFTLDGIDRTAEAAVSASGFSYLPAAPLGDGGHAVAVAVADFSGKMTTAIWDFTVDVSRPVVSILEPSGRWVGEEPPVVEIVYGDAGTGVDPSSLQLDLDGADAGAACTARPDGATCSFASLASGSHRLDVGVADFAGNGAATRQDFTFVLDLEPPQLALVSPADGSLVGAAVVRVEGTASDESRLTLTVNGQSAGVSGNAFSTVLNLPQGANELRVVAVDELGRSAEALASIFVDSVSPAVTLDLPRAGQTTNRDSAAVRGTASDANGVVRVEVAGEEIAAPGGFFDHRAALTEGVNLVTVRAFDAAGNIGEATVEVTLFSLPMIEIESPPDLSYITAPTVEVSGTVSDPETTVRVNGVPAAVADGRFVATGVPLIEGGNVVTATVASAAGRVGSDSVNVVRDLTAPRLSVRHPRDGARLFADRVDVSGMVNDIVTGTVNAAQATVTVGGVAAEVANRSFFAADVPLAVGENVLTLVATDASGNVGSAQVTVIREAAPRPQVTVVSGNRQQAVAGQALPQPLVVELRDRSGVPLAGETVLFKVVGSDGSLDGGERRRALVTDAAGRAEVRFTLGTRVGVGNQVVEAIASRFLPAVFTASALPGPPALVVVDAGDQQLGTAGQPLPRPLVAAVTDAGYNRLLAVPVTFFVDQGDGQFLDGSQEVTVLSDGDGRAIVPFVPASDESDDADVVVAVIAGQESGPRASFVSYGRAAGEASETAITGVVLDNSNRPVPGVTLRILDTTVAVQADADGLFRIAPAPVGTVKLIADGSTATRPGPWPDLEFTLTTIAGRDNDLGMPIFLLPLDLGNSIVVDETRGGTLTLPEVPGFALEVAPGSATFPGGSKSGLVSVTTVHSDKVPMVPNFGQQPRLIVTIQPAGARFDPPARLTLPNLESLPPGMVTELYSLDHDLGHFVSIGPATVREDGLAVVSNPGVGILKAGWHCGGNPAATGTPADCPPCQICNGSVCVPGCSISGASTVAPGSTVASSRAVSADELLDRIFAAQCTCDDKDECTINDRCDGSGGCTGDPVTVNKVDGACVGAVGSAVDFTADSNAPDRVKWNSSGAPPTSKGGSYSATWSSQGDKTVRAMCKSSSKSKVVTIADDCSTITPALVEPEVADTPVAGTAGHVRHVSRVTAKYNACADSSKWCFRLEEYLEEHGFSVSAPLIDVPSATDAVVTPTSCTTIISDFTPTTNSRGPPRSTYWSSAITRVHERFHVTDFKSRVTDKVFADLTAFVAQSSHCTDCKSATPAATFNAEARRLLATYMPTYFDGNQEPRAHSVSNPLYASLIAQVRQRARNAPPSENWPAACK